MTPEQREIKLHIKTLKAAIDYLQNRMLDCKKFEDELIRANKLLKQTTKANQKKPKQP
jgi:hypothetical protein